VKLLVIAGLLVAAALALLVSPFASGSPDGLNKVAEREGFGHSEREHALSGSPVAGYSVRGIEGDGMSTALAGLIGVLATFGAGLGAFASLRLLRARRNTSSGGKT
jgi:hypothetical protein